MTLPEAAAPTPAGRLPPPPRWVRNLVVGLIGSAIVLGWIGDMVWGSLVDRHPLGLILLNAKPRYLLLTSNELDPVSYYVVGTLRLVWTKPLVWLIGAWYGERAIRWAERRWDGRGRVLRPAQRIFGRWGWIVVLVTSSNVICLLAGASGMPLLLFIVLAVLGTIVRLVVIRIAGDVLEQPIDWVIGIIAANRVLVVALSVTVVVGSILWERRRGRGQLEDLASLDEALDEADAERASSQDLAPRPGRTAPGPRSTGGRVGRPLSVTARPEIVAKWRELGMTGCRRQAQSGHRRPARPATRSTPGRVGRRDPVRSDRAVGRRTRSTADRVVSGRRDPIWTQTGLRTPRRSLRRGLPGVAARGRSCALFRRAPKASRAGRPTNRPSPSSPDERAGQDRAGRSEPAVTRPIASRFVDTPSRRRAASSRRCVVRRDRPSSRPASSIDAPPPRSWSRRMSPLAEADGHGALRHREVHAEPSEGIEQGSHQTAARRRNHDIDARSPHDRQHRPGEVALVDDRALHHLRGTQPPWRLGERLEGRWVVRRAVRTAPDAQAPVERVALDHDPGHRVRAGLDGAQRRGLHPSSVPRFDASRRGCATRRWPGSRAGSGRWPRSVGHGPPVPSPGRRCGVARRRPTLEERRTPRRRRVASRRRSSQARP